jgi:hypothetical protein
MEDRQVQHWSMLLANLLIESQDLNHGRHLQYQSWSFSAFDV